LLKKASVCLGLRKVDPGRGVTKGVSVLTIVQLTRKQKIGFIRMLYSRRNAGRMMKAGGGCRQDSGGEKR